jgi:hypothetical protein
MCFDNRKNVFLVVCVGKTTNLNFQPIETHAETPTKEVEVEAADLSQLAIQDRKVFSARVVGVALFIKFEEAEGETEMALEGASGAAAEARVAGSDYEATAAALGPAMRALSTSTGLGFAQFGALAGVGKGQRVSTECKCFTKCRLWLIIKTTSNALSFCQPSPSHVCRQRKLVLHNLCAQSGGGRCRCSSAVTSRRP